MTAQYNQARQIFFQTNQNNVKIAEATGVSRKTIGLWMKEGKWKQLKRGTEIMPIALAQNIQLQLLELQKSIQNRLEGNRFPTMQEAEIQRKLIVSYTKIGATPFSVSNDNIIKSTIWRSYFSYYQGIKSANSKHYLKTFMTQIIWKRTSQMVDFIMLSLLSPSNDRLYRNAYCYK